MVLIEFTKKVEEICPFLVVMCKYSNAVWYSLQDNKYGLIKWYNNKLVYFSKKLVRMCDGIASADYNGHHHKNWPENSNTFTTQSDNKIIESLKDFAVKYKQFIQAERIDKINNDF